MRGAALIRPGRWQRYQDGKSASSMTRVSACDDQSFTPSNWQKRRSANRFASSLLAACKSKVRWVMVDWCPLSDKTFFVNFAT